MLTSVEHIQLAVRRSANRVAARRDLIVRCYVRPGASSMSPRLRPDGMSPPSAAPRSVVQCALKSVFDYLSTENMPI